MTAISELRKAMGLKPKLQEVSTGMAMTNPTSISLEIAAAAIQEVDINPMIRDLGAIVGRELADELERLGMRPADYAGLPNNAEVMALKIASALVQMPDAFANALAETLRGRG